MTKNDNPCPVCRRNYCRNPPLLTACGDDVVEIADTDIENQLPGQIADVDAATDAMEDGTNDGGGTVIAGNVSELPRESSSEN